MDKNQIISALKLVREHSPKRKFKQKVDLIVNLRGLDLKKPEHQVDQYVALPHPYRKFRIGAIIGKELDEQAKSLCDSIVRNDEFARYAGNKKEIKKVAKGVDMFIAQATFMPEIAKVFGRVFGPLGMMPNPKAGCVVPPNANIKPLIERLQKTIRATAKDQPTVKIVVGSEEMPDEQIADNILHIMQQITGKLPQEAHNIKNLIVKFSMGPPVIVGEKEEAVKARLAPKAGKPAASHEGRAAAEVKA